MSASSSEEGDVDFLALEGGSNAAAAADESSAPSTVLYVGHLPHGLYEEQLGKFFGQFGRVSGLVKRGERAVVSHAPPQVDRVKVSRATRSAASKGYGWVRFKDAEVAAIAAKAMDGYMLFGKKLVVRLMPADQVTGPLLLLDAV